MDLGGNQQITLRKCKLGPQPARWLIVKAWFTRVISKIKRFLRLHTVITDYRAFYLTSPLKAPSASELDGLRRPLASMKFLSQTLYSNLFSKVLNFRTSGNSHIFPNRPILSYKARLLEKKQPILSLAWLKLFSFPIEKLSLPSTFKYWAWSCLRSPTMIYSQRAYTLRYTLDVPVQQNFLLCADLNPNTLEKHANRQWFLKPLLISTCSFFFSTSAIQLSERSLESGQQFLLFNERDQETIWDHYC